MTAPANRVCDAERVANATPTIRNEQTYRHSPTNPDTSSGTSATRTSEKPDEVSTGSGNDGAPRQPRIPEPARSQILAALADAKRRRTEESA